VPSLSVPKGPFGAPPKGGAGKGNGATFFLIILIQIFNLSTLCGAKLEYIVFVEIPNTAQILLAKVCDTPLICSKFRYTDSLIFHSISNIFKY